MRAVVQRVSRAKVTVDGETTGEIGNGKIFVLLLEYCIRILTGECGSEAIY